MAAVELAQGAPSQLQYSQGVGKAAGLSSVKGEIGRAQLSNPPQPLKRRGVDQLDRQRFSGVVPVKADRAMEGVVVSAGSNQLVASSCWLN